MKRLAILLGVAMFISAQAQACPGNQADHGKPQSSQSEKPKT